MNNDIRISTNFFGHPKTMKLMAQFGDEGIIRLLKLWIWAAKYKPKGIMSNMDDLDWATAFDLCGEHAVSIATSMRLALLKIGFLEKGKKDEIFLHDWNEHNPYAFYAPERKQKAKKAANVRWGKRLKGMLRASVEQCGEHRFSNAPSPTPSPIPSPSPLDNNTPAEKPQVPKSKPEKSDHKIFVDFWCDNYQKRFEIKYDFTPKDAKLIQILLKSNTLDQLKSLALTYWESTDPFVINAGYNIAIFKTRINAIALQERGFDGKPKKLTWFERKSLEEDQRKQGGIKKDPGGEEVGTEPGAGGSPVQDEGAV